MISLSGFIRYSKYKMLNYIIPNLNLLVCSCSFFLSCYLTPTYPGMLKGSTIGAPTLQPKLILHQRSLDHVQTLVSLLCMVLQQKSPFVSKEKQRKQKDVRGWLTIDVQVLSPMSEAGICPHDTTIDLSLPVQFKKKNTHLSKFNASPSFFILDSVV